MADTKITALAAIGANPINVATFPIPMVDLLDNSMAASGTTKKVTVNQILGAGGTATLASATISGALTVDTTTLVVNPAGYPDRVGIGTASPALPLEIYKASGDSKMRITSGANSLTIGWDDPNGFYYTANTSLMAWQLSGSTAMTLNATGLGVGDTPASNTRLTVAAASRLADTTGQAYIRSTDAQAQDIGAQLTLGGLFNASSHYAFAGIAGRKENSTSGNVAGYLDFLTTTSGGSLTSRMRIDSTGNVGIGVTPSAWFGGRAIDLQLYGNLNTWDDGSAAQIQAGFNFYQTGSTFKYKISSRASMYRQRLGVHSWHYDTGTQTANADCAFTQAMTLDASGNLLVGTPTNTNVSRIFSRGTATSSALALQGASGDVALAQLTVGKFDNNTTTSQIFVRFTINDNSGGSGQINANGASQAAFGTFSDSRLKENIVSLPSQLANILSLRPVEFDYKDGSGHQIGFVAQEMQEVYSDAVGEQNGFLTVTGWSKTEARLVSAIKELAAKVQALEAKLA